MGCRCINIENRFLIKNPENKIILILNKIDLVPLEVAYRWKEHLSNFYPTILFKSNTQEQSKNLGQNKLFAKSILERKELADKLIKSSKALGSQKLLELIKNYSKIEGIKRSVVVGVIGYPNVGKSSLINSMTNRKVSSVSNQPGHTKFLKEIDIDKQVRIIDSPGVFITSENEIDLLLRNSIKAE